MLEGAGSHCSSALEEQCMSEAHGNLLHMVGDENGRGSIEIGGNIAKSAYEILAAPKIEARRWFVKK